MFLRALRGFRSSAVSLAKKDFYSILGVSKSSSESDIKKAYFALAKKYHPDVNKEPEAKNKFAEISTAYETLGNPEKRRLYDDTGMTGDEQDQAKNSGFDPENFGGFNPFGGFSGGGFSNFQDIFNNFEDFFGGGTGKKEKVNYKGEDISLTLEIPFMDSVKGVKKQVSLERKSQCSTCKGTKIKPGTTPTKCTNCGGRGVVFLQRGPMSIQTICTKCKGNGSVVKNPCSPCKGTGNVYVEVSETVNIPAGVTNGQSLRMASKGHFSESSGPQGDLLIKVQVTAHPVFKREGNDILSDIQIEIPQAVLGGVVEAETAFEKVKVVVEPGTSPGDKFRINGQGAPLLPPNHHKKGDHVFTFKIKVPKSLSDKQKKLYQQLASEDDEQSEGIFSKFKTFYK
jgi:molecular chaperone DnaJ